MLKDALGIFSQYSDTSLRYLASCPLTCASTVNAIIWGIDNSISIILRVMQNAKQGSVMFHFPSF